MEQAEGKGDRVGVENVGESGWLVGVRRQKEEGGGEMNRINSREFKQGEDMRGGGGTERKGMMNE